MLLVLDGCEHLIETVATLTESIFKEALRSTFWQQAGKSLRVEGEQVYRLLPLGTPPGDQNITAGQGVGFSSCAALRSNAFTASGSRFELDRCRCTDRW